ncbi:hypothetical protein FKM82_029697 [Ascaphus truei]
MARSHGITQKRNGSFTRDHIEKKRLVHMGSHRKEMVVSQDCAYYTHLNLPRIANLMPTLTSSIVSYI